MNWTNDWNYGDFFKRSYCTWWLFRIEKLEYLKPIHKVWYRVYFNQRRTWKESPKQ